ncbi:MAG: hypothetical protein NC218_10995 [Acetobacter sp.]|nr:hypothetical protein [Acetobacter sp.]
MENQKTAKMMAKSKVKLSAVSLGLFVLLGGLVELQREQAPLSQATVIYVKGREVATAAGVPVSEAVAVVEDVKPVAKDGVSADEFLRFLQETSDKVDALEKPASPLAQIMVVPVEAEEKAPEVVFDERVIEVMDDNGEVVEIVEVVEAPTLQTDVTEDADVEVKTEEPMEEETVVLPVEVLDETAVEERVQDGENGESVEDASVSSEVAVNTEEKLQEVIEIEEEAPAIDMMKDIIAREQNGGDEK